MLGAAHPLRLRQAVLTDRRGQRHASAYALAHLPAAALRRAAADPRRPATCARLFDTWSGPRWRGTPDYARRGRSATPRRMRIHPVAHCSLEFFRWAVRSLPRPDGRGLRRVDAPADRACRCCSCTATSTAACWPAPRRARRRYVSADYEWRLLTGVGHFPQHEAPDRVSAELIRWAKLG